MGSSFEGATATEATESVFPEPLFTPPAKEMSSESVASTGFLYHSGGWPRLTRSALRAMVCSCWFVADFPRQGQVSCSRACE